MSNELNQEVLKKMSIGIDKLREEMNRQKAEQERKQWKPITLPSQLSDLLSNLSKNDLDNIRINLGVQNTSSLNKAQLIERLVPFLPVSGPLFIKTFDNERYNLIKKFVNQSGFVDSTELSEQQVTYFKEYGFAFPVIINNHKVLYMPDEMIKAILTRNLSYNEETIKRNTEWIHFIKGLLYYYGVMDRFAINDQLEHYYGPSFDYQEFWYIITMSLDYYKDQINLTPYGYKHARVQDPQRILQEQKKIPNVLYYLFTKDQLIQAGEPQYYEQTQEMKQLLSLLSKQKKYTKMELDYIAQQFIYIINNQLKTDEILQFIESQIEIPSIQFIQEFFSIFNELNNQTRMWILKGNTPNELYKIEKRTLKPIQNSAPHPKVGRNDLCPCGSGLKFKKCCINK